MKQIAFYLLVVMCCLGLFYSATSREKKINPKPASVACKQKCGWTKPSAADSDTGPGHTPFHLFDFGI